MSYLSPESEAFLANPDDPRTHNANKVTFTREDGGFELRISFPEGVGEDIVEHGLPASVVYSLGRVLAVNGFTGGPSEDGSSYTFVPPPKDQQDQAPAA